jgi:hypothetical protein
MRPMSGIESRVVESYLGTQEAVIARSGSRP